MRRAVGTAQHKEECEICAADFAFLGMKDRPDYESTSPQIRVVDLFAGGGGFTMGAAEAARRAGRGTTVALAVENDAESKIGRSVGRRQHPAELWRSRVLARCRGYREVVSGGVVEGDFLAG
jgi:hypothetical protein